MSIFYSGDGTMRTHVRLRKQLNVDR